ncbi:MAG: hypothetical protein AAF986_08210 [Pseudomonadota bacterium]
MQKATIAAFCAVGMLMSTAHANTKQDVIACKAALADEVSTDATVKVASIKGSSVKRITFSVSTDGDKETHICRVKRGKVRSMERV